ncbi:MAG: hypothetical protein V4702_05890 [Patescibacteria group bacterium]
MARTKKQKILRYVILPLVTISTLGVLSYVLIVRPMQIRNQKQQFEKAEASLDTLAAQIEQTIGKPDETKKEKTCGRANLKSSQGPLICSIRSYLLFRSKTADSASSLMAQLSTLSNKELRIGSGAARGTSFTSSSPQKGEQTFYQDFSLDSEPSCSFSYSYPATDREFTVEGENFELGLVCGGKSLSQLYPIKD